jgi:hypothetical protein
MNARIDPPRRCPWLARLAFWYTRRATGEVPEPLRILARRPRLMLSAVVYEWAIARTPRLRPRLAMLAELPDYGSSDAFDDLDGDVIALAERLTLTLPTSLRRSTRRSVTRSVMTLCRTGGPSSSRNEGSPVRQDRRQP